MMDLFDKTNEVNDEVYIVQRSTVDFEYMNAQILKLSILLLGDGEELTAPRKN